MISFVGKSIETIERTTGKRVSVKVVWKNFKFAANFKDKQIEIFGWNDLSNSKYVYALPTNTYHSEWHKRPYVKQDDPDAIAMSLRFWGKYKQGMIIYGKIVNDIFYESKPKPKLFKGVIKTVTTKFI